MTKSEEVKKIPDNKIIDALVKCGYLVNEDEGDEVTSSELKLFRNFLEEVCSPPQKGGRMKIQEEVARRIGKDYDFKDWEEYNDKAKRIFRDMANDIHQLYVKRMTLLNTEDFRRIHGIGLLMTAEDAFDYGLEEGARAQLIQNLKELEE